jgi:CARDB
LQIIPALPNLVATALSFSPTSVNPGGSINLSGTVANNGNAATGTNIKINFFLSTSRTQIDYNLFLHSFVMNALAAGQSRNFNETVTVPANTAADLYYVWISIDPDKTIPESNDDDNQSPTSSRLQVQVIQPNLSIISPTLSPNPVPMNQTETISATVKETGGAAATNREIRYYLSTDNVYSGGTDIYLGNDFVTLPANGSGTQTHAFIPQNVSGISPGTYFVIIVIVV